MIGQLARFATATASSSSTSDPIARGRSRGRLHSTTSPGSNATRYPAPIVMTTMTQYDRTFTFPAAFPPQSLTGSFAEVMAAQGSAEPSGGGDGEVSARELLLQLRHRKAVPGEDRILVPSPKVPTYDMQPEMSAKGITDNLVHDVEGRKHDVIICNFANADMVGHTGNLEAAIDGRRNDRPLPRPDRESRARRGRRADRDGGSRQRRRDVELPS